MEAAIARIVLLAVRNENFIFFFPNETINAGTIDSLTDWLNE